MPLHESAIIPGMGVGSLISVEEYLHTSFDPDCDYVEGEVLERNVGTRKHAYAQGRITAWFLKRQDDLQLDASPEFRIQVAQGRFRVPDVVVCDIPMPEDDILTSPAYLLIEIMSPDDTMAGMQDRIDDYHAFGVPNVWVIDPWRHRGWTVTPAGWATAMDGVMRTSDARVAMPLSDVLLP